MLKKMVITRQPAWKTGGCTITACLAQIAAAGYLAGASSPSGTRDKSCHLHFLCIMTKVFASQ
jgi:hypothetical protein